MSLHYRQNTYRTKADTVITRVDMTDDGYTALCFRDQLFFPGGGGQPKETTGRVILRGQAFGVNDLIKYNGDVLVVLAQRAPFHIELRKGEYACLCLDASYRIRAARCHTQQHLYGAAARMVVPGYESRGMEIAPDLSRCEMRFQAASPLSSARLDDIQALAAAAAAAELPVKVYDFENLDSICARYGGAFRLDSTLPPFKGNRLRTVVIGEDSPLLCDATLCGGTHVGSTYELGRSEIIDCDWNADTFTTSVTFRLAALP